MERSVNALNDFISDFALKQPSGVVYFYANLQFVTNNQLHLLNSDVHIVTSDNLAAIYILSKESNPLKMPDMFTAKKDVYTYVEGQHLRIDGTAGFGKYTVIISPNQQEIL